MISVIVDLNYTPPRNFPVAKVKSRDLPQSAMPNKADQPASRDNLYADLASDLESFVFDAQVTRVFADMIRRSVPGYAAAISMTGVIAAEVVRDMPPGTPLRIYDLGCSRGASLMAMGKLLPDSAVLVGVDYAAPMIDACREACAALPQTLELHQADVQDVAIHDAAVVVLNYTMQFLPPAARLPLLETIYQGLLPGGAVIVSEKLAFEDADTQRRMTAMHHAFKRENGYSELEIAQKRSALENVLIPETERVHVQRLEQAGFAGAQRWQQCLNFASFVAYKP